MGNVHLPGGAHKLWSETMASVNSGFAIKLKKLTSLLECVVLSPSLYMLIQSISVNILEYSATMHLDFGE